MSATLTKSKFVQRLSWVVRCPCRIYLRTYWASYFFQISLVACPGPYDRHFVIFFKGIFLFSGFLSIVVNRLPMGAKTSKRYSFLKSLSNFFKLFVNFLLHGSHKKKLFWVFEILSLPFFHAFVRFHWYGTLWKQKIQRDIPPSNRFWISPNSRCFFFSVVVTKVCVLDFWNFEFMIFKGFFLKF